MHNDMANRTKNQDRLNFAGDYSIDSAEIISYQIGDGGPGVGSEPVRMDIKNIIATIELQENIFNHTMVGKIQVYDTQDVRTILPLTGLEKLNLAFSTPGMTGPRFLSSEYKSHPFHIYRVETVATENTATAHQQAYDIFFCSRESYFNNMHKVSKAYNGPIELAVEDIFTNRKYLSSKKDIFIEKTKFPCKQVIPNMKPFTAIDMLCSKAVSEKYINALYLFYETYRGYHFRSIESLLAMGGAGRRPAKWKYQMQQQNIRHHTGGKEIMKDMHGVMSWSLSDPINTLENLNEGAYANTLIEHDMFNKIVNITEFNYETNWDKHYHTEMVDNNTKLPRAKFDDTGKKLSEKFDQRVFLKSSTSAVHTQVGNDGVTVNAIASIPSRFTTQKIVSQRKLLEEGILTLMVPGLSVLNAGDIINFDMPVMTPLAHNQKQQSNPYWGGRYLIYNIKHSISKSSGEYTMQIKAFKESMSTAYPRESDEWSHVGFSTVHDIDNIDKQVIDDAGISDKFGV